MVNKANTIEDTAADAFTGEVIESTPGTLAVIENNVEEQTAVLGANDLADDIAALRDPGTTLYSSIVIKSREDVVQTMKALTDSVKLVDDEGNLFAGEISLKDVIVQQVEIIQDDGTKVKAPRVLLIDLDGTVYHATSAGLLSALRTFFGIAGTPDTWGGAVYQVRVKRQKSRRGFFYFTLVFV